MPATSHQDAETPRWLPAVRWCLRIVVWLQGIGIAGRYFQSPNEVESDVFGVLYFDWQWPEATALQIDDWGALTCVAAGCVVVVAGIAQTFASPASRLARLCRTIEVVAALTAAMWMLTLAVTHMMRGDAYAELSLGEHAVRFTAPFVLALLAIKPSAPRRPVRDRIAVASLAIASAATFAVHGYKAVDCYGPFLDLILLSDARFLASGMAQTTAEYALIVIGVVDIAVAVLLMPVRWRLVALYMAAWGLITAASRMTAFGWLAWPHTLMRAANYGAPLAVLLYLVLAAKPSGEIAMPAKDDGVLAT